MPPLCALVGALLVTYPLEHFGRKKTLIGIIAPFMLGFMLMGLTYFSRHKAMLFVGRLITGLVNGALTPSSQIYVSQKTHRLCNTHLTRKIFLNLVIID